MLDCDWCAKLFGIKQLWNVEYNNGNANVLCQNCLDESIELFENEFVEAWR
jgi:hypothetical protein